MEDIKTIKNQNEEVENKILELPLNLRVKALAIYHYTIKKQQLDNELEETIRKLQKENDFKAIPLYDQQNQIIQGTRPATQEELAKIDQYFENDFNKDELINSSAPIQNYWGKAIQNCEEIQMRSNPEGKNERDADLLKHLKRIQVELSQTNNDFTLVFTFEENEYFTNTELRKKFFFPSKEQVEANQDYDEDFPFKTETTEIHWKEGKNITKKTIQKKQKNKKTGASRQVNKVVDCDSFFNFFRNLTFEGKDNLDDEALGELDIKMENDFEVGKTIQEEVVPYSLEYFLGINPEHEDDGLGEEDYEDNDEEDDDDDEDNKKHSKNKRKKSGDSKKSDDKKDKGADKPDCKQQ